MTSGFAMRMHPILNSWKQHNGVDYGAPAGTPVRTVGEGVVEFAGWQNGYGNVVQVRHGNERLTVYAHLSRIDVAKGQRVDQGAIIGAVGQTGWATGPHLHFEVKIDGLQQDPLLVAQSSEAAVVAPASKVALRPAGAERSRPARRRRDAAAGAAPGRVVGPADRGSARLDATPRRRRPDDLRDRLISRMGSLFIGLMSGTSLDGIDGVVVDFAATRGSAGRSMSSPTPSARSRPTCAPRSRR